MATSEEDWPDPDSLKFEREVLLTEYKAHEENVFKWQSYCNQAVGGYLGALSILATFVAGKDMKLEGSTLQFVLIALVYVSLALLYVLLQFRFMMVSHVRYIEQNLIPEIRALCPKRTKNEPSLLDWECIHGKYRSDTLKQTRRLFKYGMEMIPYLVVVVTWFWYACRFMCEHIDNLRSLQPSEPWLTSLAYLFFGVALSLCLLIWIFCSNRKVSGDLREAAKPK